MIEIIYVAISVSWCSICRTTNICARSCTLLELHKRNTLYISNFILLTYHTNFEISVYSTYLKVAEIYYFVSYDCIISISSYEWYSSFDDHSNNTFCLCRSLKPQTTQRVNYSNTCGLEDIFIFPSYFPLQMHM